MKKKIISIFAAAFILAAFCVPSVGFAALTPASPAVFDFEDQTPGTDVVSENGWTVALGTGTHRVQYVKDPLDPENQVLDTYCAAVGKDTDVTYQYSSYTSGKAIFDFNYMLTRSVGNDAQFRLISSKTEKFAVDCQNGSWKYRIGGGTWITVPNKTAAINTWYHIIIVLDPDTEKISFWLDGSPVLQNEDSKIDITNINKFRIYNRCTAISNGKSVYFDNIRCSYTGTDTTVNAAPVFNQMNRKKTINLGDTLEVDFTGRVVDTDGDTVTLTSDKGSMEGNVLRYTPDSSGTQAVTVTADDGKDTSAYTIAVEVIPKKVNLTVTGDGQGTVTPSGTTAVVKGSTQTITATPADGWMVESVKINDAASAALESFNVTVDEDTTVEVTFAEIPKTAPSVSTVEHQYIPDDKTGSVTFGTVKGSTDSVQEYGVVYSETNGTSPEIGADGCYKLEAKKALSNNGHYGIQITGDLLLGKTYYTRSYIIYTDAEGTAQTVYGDVKTIRLNERK